MNDKISDNVSNVYTVRIFGNMGWGSIVGWVFKFVFVGSCFVLNIVFVGGRGVRVVF